MKTHTLMQRTALATVLALAAVPAHSASVVFTTEDGAALAAAASESQPIVLAHGTTQIALSSGALASFVGPADFAISGDDTITVRSGSLTVVVRSGRPVTVELPGDLRAQLSGAGDAASFTSVAGKSAGSVLAGHLHFSRPGGPVRELGAGQFWSAVDGRIARRLAGGPMRASDSPASRHGGPAEAAHNGLPLVLGDALAAAGASSDLVSAARRIEAYNQNPRIQTFPGGDYSALAAYATRAASAYGSPSFRGAGADIVLAYFQYLASGRQGSTFLTAYAQVLVSYLDLLRAGALPSSFTGASQSQVAAYIAYLRRSGGTASLSLENRTLLYAYLDFLGSGGNPDGFAPRLAALTAQYLDFLRGGGDPAAFTAIGRQALIDYLAIVQSGGIKAALTAQNRAFIDAYIASLKANGDGLAFLTTEANALAAFSAYLKSGGLPSGYSALDAAALVAYLRQLVATGLVDLRLGESAGLLKAYLTWIDQGGAPDAFAQLPANVWANESAALSAYYAYLLSGGLPSGYTALTKAQILAYLNDLKASGKFDALLADNAAFYSAFLAYLAAGNDPDAYPALPNVNLTAYASALGNYYAYLAAGGKPSAYSALTQAEILAYLRALSASGRLAELLGANATFFSAYLVYLADGGTPDSYSGLPTGGGGSGGGGTGSFTRVASTNGYNAMTVLAQIAPDKTRVEGFFAGDAPHAADGVAFNDGGTPTRIGSEGGGITFTLGTATAIEQAGNADINIGRYTGGSVSIGSNVVDLSQNQGAHYLVMAPVGAIPLNSGVVEYAQLAATSPTYALGGTAPGSFEGHMRVAFGGTVKVALMGTITMPDATYAFGSASEFDNVASKGQSFTASDFTYFVREPMSGAAHGCAGGACTLLISGALAGDNGQYAGIDYLSNLDDSDRLLGAAIFGAPGTALGGGSSTGGGGGAGGGGAGGGGTGGGGTGGGAGFAEADFTIEAGPGLDGGIVRSVASGAGSNILPKFRLAANTDGSATNTFYHAIGTAKNVDMGTIASLVGWTRWTDGTVTDHATDSDLAVGPDGGIAQIWGQRAANLPTNGSASYTMAGATKPVLSDGSAAPGKVNSARLDVDFAANQVSFGANLSIAGKTVEVAGPGVGILSGSDFVGTAMATGYTNGNANASYRGFLAGPGGTAAGLGYTISTTGLPSITGVVAFNKGP